MYSEDVTGGGSEMSRRSQQRTGPQGIRRYGITNGMTVNVSRLKDYLVDVEFRIKGKVIYRLPDLD